MNLKPAESREPRAESRKQRAERRRQTALDARPSALDQTRGQLLEAAGEVFAEVGFRNATVREICRRAGANVAAVNYHFGDKEQLYAEVLHYSQQKAFDKYPPLLDVAPDAPPEEKLHAFVRSFLLRIFDNSQQFGKIMSREMVEPTAALNALLETRMRPMAGLLGGIVAEILAESRESGVESRKQRVKRRAQTPLDPRPPTLDQVRLCSFSIVSQCVFFHHCRTMICRLFPEQKLDVSAVDQLAGHVTRFSLAAMRHLPRGVKQDTIQGKMRAPTLRGEADSKTARSGRKRR